ncbi:MAG TPA: glycosyl hydrolase [Burkholderiales bacterium]|nr:glycosyl hydrolase [Burkholderiales bacterium]
MENDMHVYYRPFLALAMLLSALPGVHFEARAQHPGADMLTHVHGLAYSADGKQLMIPSHHGLALYRDGKWSKAPGPAHDYMGFAAARTRLYSSGHPAPGTGLANPFGLIRSGDGGKSWVKLSLEGESDFHLLAASWNTNAVYVWNGERNSRMPSPGLYYTLNEGFIWQRAAAKGVSGAPRAIAVHPADPKIVAVATPTGIYLSRNSGESFEAVAGGTRGLAVFFDLDGKQLWHSTYDGSPRLARAPLQGGANAAVTLPPLTEDAVAYVAQNPAVEGEYAIATFERSVFVTRDSGRTWRQIARIGKGL